MRTIYNLNVINYIHRFKAKAFISLFINETTQTIFSIENKKALTLMTTDTTHTTQDTCYAVCSD